MHNRRGWTLTEIMVTTAIATALAAVTASQLIGRTRVDGYEHKALATLNLLSAGFEDYFWTTTNPHRYPRDFGEVATSQVAYVLDPLTYVPATKQQVAGDQYVYVLSPILTNGSPLGYTLRATPAPTLVGARTFVMTKNNQPASGLPTGGAAPPPAAAPCDCAVDPSCDPSCPPLSSGPPASGGGGGSGDTDVVPVH